MAKSILTLTAGLLLALFSNNAGAQSYSIQRGHTADDLYIYCRKNATSNSVMQFYHLWEHGKKISVQYTIPYPSTNNDLNLKNFVADLTPGLLYCTSVENLETPIYQSTDYGISWQLMNINIAGMLPPVALLGGSVAGEIIMTERLAALFFGIGSTTDFFATHILNVQYTSYFTKPEIGITSGEIYGINNAYTNNRDFLLHSQDFGVSIDTIPIDSAIVYNPNGNLAQKVCHGTQAGEIYLVTLEPEQSGFPHVYKIYHSTDYGSTYSYKSELKFEESSSYTDFTGGRDACSFYVVNWKFDQQLQRQIMQVYYSADCGQTFTLFEHDLNAYVSINELQQEFPGDLFIYPNPAKDKTTIKYMVKKPSTLSVEVYNSIGKCVYKVATRYTIYGEFVKTITTEGFASGMYTIQISTNGKIISSGKLLISEEQELR